MLEVIDEIVPKNGGQFGVARARNLIGVTQFFVDEADRDAFDDRKLIVGQDCYTIEPTRKKWVLVSKSPSVWQEDTSGGGGGGSVVSVDGIAPDVNGNIALNAVVEGDPRLTDARFPTGPAGGDFFGSNYPSPRIALNVVENNNLVIVASKTLKGRVDALDGVVQDLSAAEATSILDTFSPTLKGLVPLSGGGTVNFLRADGAFAPPIDPTAEKTANKNANGGYFGKENDGGLVLPTVVTPALPGAGSVKLFARNVASRMLPAIVGPSGLETSLQPLLGRNKIGLWSALGNTTATPISAFGIAAATVTGTATARNVDANTLLGSTKRIAYVSPVAAASVSTIRLAVAQFSRKYGFFYLKRFAISDAVLVAAGRAFFGMRDRTLVQSDQSPFGFVNALGVAVDAADANWSFCHNDATGLAPKTDTGIVVDNTSLLELAIFAAPGSSSVTMLFTNLSTGVSVSYTTATEIPADTTLMTTNCFRSTGADAVNAAAFDFVSWYIETDF